jgi:beta-glucosidase
VSSKSSGLAPPPFPARTSTPAMPSLSQTLAHLPIALALFLPSALGAEPFLPTLSDNSPKAWPARAHPVLLRLSPAHDLPAASTGGHAWGTAFTRAKALVANMTLEEKTTLITGQPGRCVGNTGAVPRLGLKSLCLEDGPAGVRPISGV